MTSYSIIFKRFEKTIEDFDLADLCEEDFYDSLEGYLDSAIARFRKCKCNLSLRNEDGFEEDLLPIEVEILADLMGRAWVEPMLKSQTVVQQAWSGKEAKFYSQSQHMEKLQALHDACIIDAHKLMRDYTYETGSGYFN